MASNPPESTSSDRYSFDQTRGQVVQDLEATRFIVLRRRRDRPCDLPAKRVNKREAAFVSLAVIVLGAPLSSSAAIAESAVGKTLSTGDFNAAAISCCTFFVAPGC